MPPSWSMARMCCRACAVCWTRCAVFSESVRSGTWRGYSGKTITDVVNIGIGGSYLGPLMVCRALHPYSDKVKVHFVSNVDGTDLAENLRRLIRRSTLFIVASKTFTTQETLMNARSARDWFLRTAVDSKHIAKHFVALSTNAKEVTAFGIDVANMFEFSDWVGGRYSLWSAIGLSIALAVGMDNFEELLRGGYEMDTHFCSAPLEQNMPVILALLGVWYNNFHNVCDPGLAALRPDAGIFCAVFPAGRHGEQRQAREREGVAVDYATGPVLWGGIGTNGQHAFFQLIHQGTQMIPSGFHRCGADARSARRASCDIAVELFCADRGADARQDRSRSARRAAGCRHG